MTERRVPRETKEAEISLERASPTYSFARAPLAVVFEPYLSH